MTEKSKLESLKCEFEAMLTVLGARAAGARDQRDWEAIWLQSKDLVTIAKKAKHWAGWR